MAADNDRDKYNVSQSGAELSLARFDDPVEFIHREHDRQNVVVGAIERLAEALDADDVRETAAYALKYLEFELPLARRRLDTGDTAELLRAIPARHGVNLDP